MPDDQLVAVVYARQSLTVGDADDSLSLESQQRVCRDYIERQGWRFGGAFVEPDTRGWRTDRPAFDRMLATMRDGRADVCVVFKLSRFARNLVHQETVLDEIAAAGGELVSVTEPFLNASPMVRQILGAVNEQAKRDQSDHLKAAYAERARRGKHHGYAPLGYRIGPEGVLEIDEPAADTVREIFAWALEGHGSPEITYRLNERGIPTATGRAWHQSTTLRTLRNAVYAGDVVFRGEVVARDAHPAIVARDVYDRVQEALDRRRGVRRKEAPSWADGFVYHACGARMHVAQWSAGSERRWRFRCGRSFTARRHRGDACDVGRKSAFADHVERTFVQLLAEALAEIATPEAALARIEAERDASAAERDRERTRLQRRAGDVRRQREKLLDLVLVGRVDDELYSERDRALKEELAGIEAQLAAVPREVPLAELAARRTALVDIAEAVPIVAHRAPDRLPALLHELDARLTIGPEGTRLELGAASAPFVRGRC